MEKFTLIYRDLSTGKTGLHWGHGEDQAAANLAFETQTPAVDVELIGVFEEHITPLWWEE